MREKRLPLPGTEIVVRMDERRARWITGSLPYRYALGPALRWLRRSRNGHAGAGAAAEPEAPVYFPRVLQQWPEETPEQQALAQEVRGHEWYHTIDLPGGFRTPGHFDHTPALKHFPLPASLKGLRCLDVATYDGFWAFEMERRGADEVVALDIESWADLDVPPYVLEEYYRRGDNRPTGTGFAIVSRLRGSRVKRQICNVYDLSPEKVGRFDIVFCGDLLVHIRNPLRAIQNIHSVTAGRAIFVEPFIPRVDTTGLGPVARLWDAPYHSRWWQFSQSFLEQAIRLGGFANVEWHGMIDVRQRAFPEAPMPRVIFQASGSVSLAEPPAPTVGGERG